MSSVTGDREEVSRRSGTPQQRRVSVVDVLGAECFASLAEQQGDNTQRRDRVGPPPVEDGVEDEAGHGRLRRAGRRRGTGSAHRTANGPYDSAGLPARTNTEQNPSATGWLSVISTAVNPALS